MGLPKRLFHEYGPVLPYLVGALIVFIAAVSGFVSLAEEVREGDALAVDVKILELINQLSAPWLDSFFTFATHLGDVIAVAAVGLAACAVLFKKRQHRSVVLLVASVLGAVIISHSLKLLFARPRPELWEALVNVTTFSFPSGHAIASSALALTLAYISWATKWRVAAVITGVVYAFLVGLSRLYLGVHYPSDVVAGWLVSTAWVLIVVGVFHLWSVRKNNAVVN